MNISILIGLAGNLVPLAGVIYWEWDPFQLLMLYWMETGIVAGFTLTRIGTLPKELLGKITVNGREQAATNRGLVGFFAASSSAFIFAHFLFLWVLFSGEWTSRVRGLASFVQEFVIQSGAWIPLLFALVSGVVAFLISPTRPRFARDLQARFRRTSLVEEAPKLDEASHGVGAVIGGLYGRIVIMQVAVIFGAMLAKKYGAQAPLLIVIGIKTLFDLGTGPMKGGTVSITAGTPLRQTKKSIRLPD